ncbi:5-formyltetrahydrofolate cyclo-ligase [Micropruina sonneratiae]|uniref:5-formyltetrahydrofolate cyclo-ligase n=1 Tax=Micropruina sonneratiae TaxID=2986940 RepID=UPI002226F666|nr:5-formyltetrahydrofolate cyclo-ligase [Micropruina sp. KQZ13P-5]MCW3158903.1 5-formyltetrahydrofolate cyclo-ligase [Micropruina sp. KQZ13P-5]
MPTADPANPPGWSQTTVRTAKDAVRCQIRRARREAEPSAAVAARTARALQVAAGHDVVAAYLSLPGEPDTSALIEALAGAGVRVLLPVLGRRADGRVRREPDWAEYAGTELLRIGHAGIAEPTTPALGADAVAGASLIWCAGLAASPTGDRLGTGGGWYDRALGHAAPDAVVGVLLRDSEVLDAVPTEPFDRPVTVIVTDARTLWTRPHLE